jgi:exosortase
MISTNTSQSILEQGASGPYTAMEQRQSRARLWALAVGTLVLIWSYAPNLLALKSTWANDPNYSHGYLVIPIALVILWRRLSVAGPEPSTGVTPAPWWGWIFLGAALATRAIAYERNSQWLETATIVPVVASLTWTFGSWPLLRRTWPAIVFLGFMLPLPGSVNSLVVLPLQQIAATGSCFLLQLSGLWAIQEGNIIDIRTVHGMERVDVAAACSGLRELMTLAATVTATIILIPLPNWKRVVLLASAVPIALVSNIIRIVATGWCYYWFQGPQAKEWAHDASGWLMMVLALLLVWLELSILSWLVPDEAESEPDKRKLMLSLLTGKKR